MKKAIVFGVGNNYRTKKEEILNQFDVVALVDNNWERITDEEVQPVSVIPSLCYDYIIITPYVYSEMKQQLIDMGIEEDRIIIFVESPIGVANSSCGLKCFGQHYDDLIVAALFGQIGIKHPSYLDLGANFPYDISNTALLYQSGSRGINIDANPILISKFEKERPDDINLNVGIASKPGRLTFYKFDETSGLNTFSKKEADKLYNNNGLKISEKIEMPVVTLQEIVDKYCNGVFPDFLDSDIEGLDYEVLSSVNMKENGPKVICVEVRTNEMDRFDELLKKQDYFRFCRIGANNIYVRNELKAKVMQC